MKTLAPPHIPYLAQGIIVPMAILSHERSFHSHIVHSIHTTELETAFIRQFHYPNQELGDSRKFMMTLHCFLSVGSFFYEKELERGVRFLERKDPCSTPNYASLI